MNANELAKGINSPHNACCYRDKCRQQQAEIENLKAGLLSHHDIYPVKELTDEEIDEVVRKWFGNSRYDFSANTWRQFSRAILRKAQE